VSIPKIKGIETEWSAIIKRGHKYRLPEPFAFNQMINIVRKHISFPTLSQNDSLNNLLPNGSRLYLDGPHIEYSTPECLSAKTLVAADKAGEAILNLARMGINKELAEEGEEIIIYKDTSDRKGHSYGCHENYLLSREAFDRITDPAGLDVGYLASFFVVRQIFTGAGKMGIESDGKRLDESIYQISQRADFIKTLLSLDTISNRGIVNTRDESLADPKRFARLHVIVGDANMAEMSTYMKVGVTSIILKMIEDEFLEGDIIIQDPVEAIKLVSRDLSCQKPVLETLEGRKLSSLDLNEEFFERAQVYFLKVVEPSPEEKDLMQKWEETISDFRTGNEERLQRRYDWKIKQAILNRFLEAYDISWNEVKDAVIRYDRRSHKVVKQLFKKDLLYHNINKEVGLYWGRKEVGELEGVVSGDEIVELVKNPPPECRSYSRGRCLAKFFSEIDTADWDEICFSNRRLRKSSRDYSVFYDRSGIDLANPIWGGKADTEEILEKSETPDDLIKNLKEEE